MPVREKRKTRSRKQVCLNLDREQTESCLEEFRRKKYRARIRLLEALSEQPELSWEYVTKELKVPADTLSGLEERKIIRVESYTVYRNPLRERDEEGTEQAEAVLTGEQASVCAGILSEWKEGPGRPCLIQGVTGSGKTLV